jgi:hypothetical protein
MLRILVVLRFNSFGNYRSNLNDFSENLLKIVILSHGLEARSKIAGVQLPRLTSIGDTH